MGKWYDFLKSVLWFPVSCCVTGCLWCCCLLCLPCWRPCGNMNNPHKKNKPYQAPQSLPKLRERALTLPLPEPTPAQRTNKQLQSPFFKFPLEIRLRIYQEVLAPQGRELHLASMHKRLACIRCFETDQKLQHLRHDCWGHRYQDGSHYKPRKGHPRDERLLSLLRTCRLIYSEAIEVLYTRNTFCVRLIRTILELPHTILPHRFHSICSLHINAIFDDLRYSYPTVNPRWPPDNHDAWPQACGIVAEMRGLRDLRVTLNFWIAFNDDIVETLLRPLVAIQVPSFIVDSNWGINADEMVKRLGDLPFSVVLTQ